jgi:hypothetical protein
MKALFPLVYDQRISRPYLFGFPSALVANRIISNRDAIIHSHEEKKRGHTISARDKLGVKEETCILDLNVIVLKERERNFVK